jgi:NTE family protein
MMFTYVWSVCSVTKALVMGGGGPVGLAWETGLAAGLAAAGVDLGDADLLLGTSAGASVCAQIALGRDLRRVVERYGVVTDDVVSEIPPLAEAGADATQPVTPGQWGATGPMARVGEMMAEALRDGRTADEARAVVGAFALGAETVDEESFVHFFRHLRDERWPERFACTAVEAETGAFTVWDAANPAELDRAVASSSAVPGVFPPVTINGRHYIDAGGVRSGASADLATAFDRVLIVTLRDPEAPTDGSPQLERSRRRVAEERAMIEAAGGVVATVSPDPLAAAAMGTNPHDATVNPVAAAAGYRQGLASGERVREQWC